MDKIIVEIYKGEGGDDSRLLLDIQYGIYYKFASKLNY